MSEVATSISPLDVEAIRAQFPVLDQQVNGKPLVYFDNAASSQKPQAVIDALVHYYQNDHANIHRGIHTLAERATSAYEEVRKKTAQFLHANSEREIVFTRGTTESINLVAESFGKKYLQTGDEIILTELEHHSNIVPWQMVAAERGVEIKVLPVNDAGELLFEQLPELLTDRTKIIALNYVSNTLGTINPVREIIQLAHDNGTSVLLDAAQASPHVAIDVLDLDVDFLALSSHKMYGPTGVGVLYGKSEWLEKMPPYQGGGEMIKEVHFSGTSYNDIPYKYEAGTPNIADVVAFGRAIDWVQDLGYENIQAHEDALLRRAVDGLKNIPGFIPYGTAGRKASVVSFEIEGVHNYDLGLWLDAKGVAVRTGHHCTQPLMDRFGIEGTVRASFAAYNTLDEIDYFVEAVNDIVKKIR